MPGLGTVFSSDLLRFRLARRLVVPAYRWMFRGDNSRVIVLNRDDLAFMTDVIGVARDRIFLMERARRLQRNAYEHFLGHCTQQATLLEALPAFASLGVAA